MNGVGLTVVGGGGHDPLAGIPESVRKSLEKMTQPMTETALSWGIPELNPPPSPPPPPPPPPARERINPMFFPQLEAEIRYEI
jgi:hypothetical protein